MRQLYATNRAPLSWDGPVPVKHHRDRGSFDLALASVRSGTLRQSAVVEFDGQKLSATTKPVYTSHSRVIARLMRETGEPLLPMNRSKP